MMIPEFRTSNPVDVFVRVLIDRTSPIFVKNAPLPRGAKYAALEGSDPKITALYPDLYFLAETVPIGSNTVASMTQHEYVIWSFSTDPTAESQSNAEITLLGDSITNPVFARTYTIRRQDWDASQLTILTPLTAIIGVEILQGGTRYNKAAGTILGPGDDGEVGFIIENGVVIDGYVKSEGRNYDATSELNVVGDGQDAIARLILQPPAAVLTSQKKIEFSEDDPRQAEFVKVLRVYEVLPGPWIPFTRYDENLGPIQGRRRAVINTGQRGGFVDGTQTRNYEGRDGSSVVSIEAEEINSDGTGQDINNPPFPELFWSTYEQPEGTVAHTKQIVANQFAGYDASYDRPSPGIVRKTWYEDYPPNPDNYQFKFTDTWLEVNRNDEEVTSQFQGGTLSEVETRGENGSLVAEPGYLTTDSKVQKASPHELIRVTRRLKTGTVWPLCYGRHIDEVTGIKVDFTKQYIDVTNGIPPYVRSGYRGPFEEIDPYDRWRSIQIVSAIDCSTLPATETRFITRPFNLPPTLLSAVLYWDKSVLASASADDNSASMVIQAGSQAAVVIEARTGYRGNAPCYRVREYHCGPFPDEAAFIPVRIFPSSGTIIVFEKTYKNAVSTTDDLDSNRGNSSPGVVYSRNSGSELSQFSVNVHTIDIRDHLIGSGTNINLNLDKSTTIFTQSLTETGGGQLRVIGNPGLQMVAESHLPLSYPLPEYLQTANGSLWLDDVVYEEWRFGLWIRERFYIDMTKIAVAPGYVIPG